MAHRDLVDLGQLSQFFHLPITEASKELGICATALKKICRKHGIPRWPARKIRSIDKIISALEESLSQTPDDENITNEIERLKSRRTELILNPSLASVAGDDRRISKHSASNSRNRCRSLSVKEEDCYTSSPEIPENGYHKSVNNYTRPLSLSVGNLPINHLPPFPSFSLNYPSSPALNSYTSLLNQPLYSTFSPASSYSASTTSSSIDTATVPTISDVEGGISHLSSSAPPSSRLLYYYDQYTINQRHVPSVKLEKLDGDDKLDAQTDNYIASDTTTAFLTNNYGDDINGYHSSQLNHFNTTYSSYITENININANDYYSGEYYSFAKEESNNSNNGSIAAISVVDNYINYNTINEYNANNNDDNSKDNNKDNTSNSDSSIADFLV